jgi:hypothetical protein
LKGSFPGLALYQVLRESGESQDNVLGRIDRAFDQLFSGDVKQMKRIGRLPFALLFFRVFLKSFMRKYPPEGWTTRMETELQGRNPVRHDHVFLPRNPVESGSPRTDRGVLPRR